MYLLKLTLMLWTIISRTPLPSEHTVLLFETEAQCLEARSVELEKLMDRVPPKVLELKTPIHAEVIGGCKAPTPQKSAAQPPESSGG